MTISPNVVILTRDELSDKLMKAHERGYQAGLTKQAAKIDPEIEERIFRLKEALLLCLHTAEGSRLAWEGSHYEIPPREGTSVGNRVNRVSEIVRQVFESDPNDSHHGNFSVAFSDATVFYEEHPTIEVRSWFGRMVRKNQTAK